MAKRFQPMKEFGRSTKKPKLDININKGRASMNAAVNSCTQTNVATARTNSSGLKIAAQSPVKCSPVSKNLWDDDDDDVILLATQVAEIQAATASAKRLDITNITDSELTFSEFAPNVYASTSTQRPPQPLKNTAALIPNQDILSQMFGDDYDDEFALLVAAVDNKQPEFKTPAAVDDMVVMETEEVAVFKKPSEPHTECTNSSKPQANPPNDNDCGNKGNRAGEATSSTAVARRQLAAERQIKFLMERVDTLKNENTKMNKDLGEAKSKMESKNGEASLLRDELRHMKQQIQTLKMEKICSTEAAKKQCKTKIAELSKQVEAKETALQLKSVEYSVLKMRHADETKRFEMSMRDGSMFLGAESKDVQCGEPQSFLKNKLNQKGIRKLKRLRALNMHAQVDLAPEPACTTSPTSARLICEQFYEPPHERGTTKMQRSLFQVELERMQTIVAQLQLKQKANEQDTYAFTKQILASVSQVFPEFWSYVHSLEFPKSCRIHPYHDYDLRLDVSEKTRQSLLQPAELFEGERALSLRRYVTVLGITCRLLTPLTQMLLTHRHGEYLVLQIAIDAICKLGYSSEICEHFGLLEAFTVLLHCMLANVSPNSAASCEKHEELLVRFLKQLIFTRPSAWIFLDVSFCVLQCTQIPAALSLLCVNSGAGTFESDRVKSLYRFSNDSCVLQVYAGLLEIAFPLSTPLRLKHFQLLTIICGNHVRFVYHCLANPPKFVHRLLPCYDEEEEEEEVAGSAAVTKISTNNNSNSTSNTKANAELQINDCCSAVSPASVATLQHCECYTKLCLSVVTLLFQLLRQWKRSHKLWETSRVAEISKISVQLLHIIFCDNYLTSLFRDTEETTKYYLALICKWWTENAEVLHFNRIHLNFLQKLQNSHVMPKQICGEENLANISADLADWCRLTSDAEREDSRTDPAEVVRKLELMDTAGHEDKFFEGLKGYAFNFQ